MITGDRSGNIVIRDNYITNVLSITSDDQDQMDRWTDGWKDRYIQHTAIINVYINIGGNNNTYLVTDRKQLQKLMIEDGCSK